MIRDTASRRWATLRQAAWWPALLLLFVQTVDGMWYMPQLSFFPVYLEERLALARVTIGAIVAVGQVSGMLAALLGGWITGMLGSKWTLVAGLVLSAIATLAFQVHASWAVALLWFAGGAGLALITVGGSSYLTRLTARGSLGMLAAFFVLSLTVGGSIGNPLAGVLIERRGFAAFGWAQTALISALALVTTLFMLYLGDRTPGASSLRSFWAGALPMVKRRRVQMLLGLRCLPTVFYGMLTVLVPLLLNQLSGSKVLVAAYGTTTLILASVAQLMAGRAADRCGARGPTLIAYSCVVVSGLGLAMTAGTVWGLFAFGVAGVAAAWSLSTLMYVWVADGVPKDEHASSFGLLHAIWSLSMIAGSLLGGWLVRTAAGLPFLVTALINVGSLTLALAYYGKEGVRIKKSRK